MQRFSPYRFFEQRVESTSLPVAEFDEETFSYKGGVYPSAQCPRTGEAVGYSAGLPVRHGRWPVAALVCNRLAGIIRAR